MRSMTFLLVLLLACGGKQEFKSASDFTKHMQENGWVRLGTFGDLKWPAKITGDKKASNEISFRRFDGTPHNYPGYDGYDLRVLHLEGAGGTKGTYVWRSKEKR